MPEPEKTFLVTLILFMAAAGQVLARSPAIAVDTENACPLEPMTAPQLNECLGESVSASHEWDSEIEVRFDLAVFRQGRVEQVVRSRSASISGGQRISLQSLELPAFEIPGGDMFVPGGDTFVPGGDTFVPGGDTFVRNEDAYARSLAEAAAEYQEDETVILLIARPHLSTLLPTVGISTTAVRLTAH